MLMGLVGCSSMQVENRVDSVVEDVRKAASVGFIDTTIDYSEPDLIIFGHAYNDSHVARLMRSIKDRGVTLVEIEPQYFERTRVSRFRLAVVAVGTLRKWNGPITLKFPMTTNPAVLKSDALALFTLTDYLFIATIGDGQQRKAVIRCPDGSSVIVQKGRALGDKGAIVEEISERSIILIGKDGVQYELKMSDELKSAGHYRHSAE
ncbi:MAG: hypothetical protein PHY62_01780 [Gallionella sp.]|nr:hypothetical protein [Gallionella sp.]